MVVAPVLLHPPLSAADLAAVSDPEHRVALRQAQAQLQNEARATLLQGLGGLILVVGALATWRQVQISRHGQLTERLTRAVDQLGGTRMDVRVGAIYALERVAMNSVDDRKAVTAILSAFVRTQSPWMCEGRSGHQHDPVAPANDPPWAGVRAGDVQIALYVLARRPTEGNPAPPFLSFSDLADARGGNRDLTGLVCQHSNLIRAWLPNTRLDAAFLDGTDLRHAHLVGASLVDASLTGAHLDGANLRNADLRGADLTGTCLNQATLDGARWDTRTRWPASYDPRR
jgi:hypothetical protein